MKSFLDCRPKISYMACLHWSDFLDFN